MLSKLHDVRLYLYKKNLDLQLLISDKHSKVNNNLISSNLTKILGLTIYRILRQHYTFN